MMQQVLERRLSQIDQIIEDMGDKLSGLDHLSRSMVMQATLDRIKAIAGAPKQ